jgi:hypothetical protein
MSFPHFASSEHEDFFTGFIPTNQLKLFPFSHALTNGLHPREKSMKTLARLVTTRCHTHPGRAAKSASGLREWAGHPLVQLTSCRFHEFRREPDAVFWVFVFPILLATGLALAFRNRPPEILKVATVGPAFAKSLRQEKLLDVRQLPAAEAEEALLMGKVALLAIPGDGATVLYRYDGTSPEGRTARMLADRAIQRGAGQVDPVTAGDDVMIKPGSRYIDFLIPGLLGMNLMNSGIWGVGLAIVDARRKMLMKCLFATPMPRHYYMLSFLFYRLLLLVLEVGTLVAFGIHVFQVPVRGSWLDLAALSALGSLSFLALGLLIGSRVRTTEAATGLMNLVMIPMCVASGVFFSSQRFPDGLWVVIKLLPLTALIDALRANM